MILVPHVSEASSPSPATPTARFGARAVLAAVALALVAVPFALMVLLVEDKWAPLLRADSGARDSLHGYAVAHAWVRRRDAADQRLRVGIGLAGRPDCGRGLAALASTPPPGPVRGDHGRWVIAAEHRRQGGGPSTTPGPARPGRPGERAELSQWPRPVGDRRIRGAAARLPAHPAGMVAQGRRHVRGVHGPGDWLLPCCSGRPLRLRRAGRFCPGRGLGGRHGGGVQRHACRSRAPRSGSEGGARARARGTSGRPSAGNDGDRQRGTE